MGNHNVTIYKESANALLTMEKIFEILEKKYKKKILKKYKIIVGLDLHILSTYFELNKTKAELSPILQNLPVYWKH